MKGWRQGPAVLLIVVLGAVTPMLEGLHRDAFAVLIGSETSLATHTCGERELHVPLGNLHQCALCTQSTHRASILSPELLSPGPGLVLLGTLTIHQGEAASRLISSLDSRGPPAA